jgi:DNA repair protein RadD
LELRPYQETAIVAIKNSLSDPGGSIVVIPTGGGKSLLISKTCELFSGRAMVLSHRKELIEEVSRHADIIGIEDVGIFSAGLNRRDRANKVIVGGIQSVVRANGMGEFDAIIVDECHRISTKNEGNYRKLIAAYPSAKLIGFTATPYRLVGGPLTSGKTPIFSKIIHTSSISELTEAGFLSPLRINAAGFFDEAGVHKRGGEFIQSELDKALSSDSDEMAKACNEALLLSTGRSKIIVFAAGLAHAGRIKDYLVSMGESCDAVFGETENREEIIDLFREGKIRWLVNVELFGEGFNVKDIDCVVMMRPTCSKGLMVQQIGRGLRIADGKQDCRILDFVGNIDRLGAIDILPEPKVEGQDDKVVPFPCSSCRDYIFRYPCEFCGFKPEPKDTRSPESYQSLLDGINKENVIKVRYSPYKKIKDKNVVSLTMRVTYTCETMEISEWISVENTGYARQKAENWWHARTAGEKLPKTVDEAVRIAPFWLKDPTSLIWKQPIGSNFKVLTGFTFEKKKEGEKEFEEDRQF